MSGYTLIFLLLKRIEELHKELQEIKDNDKNKN